MYGYVWWSLICLNDYPLGLVNGILTPQLVLAIFKVLSFSIHRIDSEVLNIIKQFSTEQNYLASPCQVIFRDDFAHKVILAPHPLANRQ